MKRACRPTFYGIRASSRGRARLALSLLLSNSGIMKPFSAELVVGRPHAFVYSPGRVPLSEKVG